MLLKKKLTQQPFPQNKSRIIVLLGAVFRMKLHAEYGSLLLQAANIKQKAAVFAYTIVTKQEINDFFIKN